MFGLWRIVVNPNKEAGKVVLITRYGAAKVTGDRLSVNNPVGDPDIVQDRGSSFRSH
jgi:hypothetical protein